MVQIRGPRRSSRKLRVRMSLLYPAKVSVPQKLTMRVLRRVVPRLGSVVMVLRALLASDLIAYVRRLRARREGSRDSAYHIRINPDPALLVHRLTEPDGTAVVPRVRRVRALEMLGDNVEARLLAEHMHVLGELRLLVLLLRGGEGVSRGPTGGEGSVARPGGALARNVGGGRPSALGGVVGGGVGVSEGVGEGVVGHLQRE